MNQLLRDLHFGFRMLIKHKTLSIIAILTFGLGIGITTTVFSIVNGVFFKGLPFEDGSRVVAVGNSSSSQNLRNLDLSVQDYAVWQQRQSVFEAMGAWSIGPINMTWPGGQPERFAAGMMSSEVFNALKVKPVIGRTFHSNEDRPGALPTIILGYNLWRERYGCSENVLGQTIRVSGITRTVIGVMSEGFAFPNRQSVWIPLEIDPLATERGKGPGYPIVARLKSGVSIEQARAQAVSIGAQLEKDFPATNKGLTATVRPFVENMLGPQIYSTLYTMLAAGIGVLLIACVNVANLLLARASLRSREIAVRMALGAGRSRIVLQFLVEVLILASAGGVLGFGLCNAGMRWFSNAIAVEPPPFFITFELDYRVMLFIALVTFAASLFAGLIPAFQATGNHVGEALKDESRASTGLRIGRFSSGLIVAEVAISCGLLIAAGLMIKSIVQLKTVDLPFSTERIFTARIHLPRAQYKDDASCIRFYEQLLPRLEAIPGIESATLSDGLPAAGNGTVAFAVEGQAYTRESDYPLTREGVVTAGYFRTFQTRVLRGREFTSMDRAGSLPVAVINESFARSYFPKDDPMGRRIRKGRGNPAAQWLTIVGIVPDMIMQGMGNNNQSGAGYYIPIPQSDVTNLVSIALRTRGEPGAVTQEVRSSVASMDPDLAIYDVLSMREVILKSSWFYMVFGVFFMAFGFSALVLAVAGLYGVMSFAVTQRTREMGVRLTLGAQGGQLVRLIMMKGVARLATGLLLGTGIGLGASSLLRTLLYRVDPHDPIVMAEVLIALAVAGLAANYIPARRVTRINPVAALSAE